MSEFLLSESSLLALLRGEDVDVAGRRETISLRLDLDSLCKVTDRRMVEILAAASEPVHGLHL